MCGFFSRHLTCSDGVYLLFLYQDGFVIYKLETGLPYKSLYTPVSRDVSGSPFALKTQNVASRELAIIGHACSPCAVVRFPSIKAGAKLKVSSYVEETSRSLKNNANAIYFTFEVSSFEEQSSLIRLPFSEVMASYTYIATQSLLLYSKQNAAQLPPKVVSKILSKLLLEEEIREFTKNSLVKESAKTRLLQRICEERVGSMGQMVALVNILMQDLPLCLIAQAKVEASFVCIFLRLQEHISSDYVLATQSGAVLSAQLPFIKKWMGDHVADLHNIRMLDLSYIHIEAIPSEIATKLCNLRTFKFSGNKQKSLNILHSLKNFPLLEELDLSDNRFISIPDFLFDSLKHLKRLNLPGNCFSSEVLSDLRATCIKRCIGLSF